MMSGLFEIRSQGPQSLVPGATTSVKDGPCPFLGTPVTLYPLMGPWAGLHLTVTLLSFTSITSISDGELTPGREKKREAD